MTEPHTPDATYLSAPEDWLDNTRLRRTLRAAARELLDAGEYMLEDGDTPIEVLADGGQHACLNEGLDPSLAVLVEAEAACLLASALDVAIRSPLDPALRTALEHLGEQPVAVQRAAFRAAARIPAAPPHPRLPSRRAYNERPPHNPVADAARHRPTAGASSNSAPVPRTPPTDPPSSLPPTPRR